jgi:hypothetical protein
MNTGVYPSIVSDSYLPSKDDKEANRKACFKTKPRNTDTAFQRTRQHMAEFSSAGRAASTLRDAFKVITVNEFSGSGFRRLFKLMIQISKTDTLNERGLRNVIDGDVGLLRGFEFNGKSEFGAKFRGTLIPGISRATGELLISIPSLIPASMIVAPIGATHVKFISAGAEIDFKNDRYFTTSNMSAEIVLNKTSTETITLNNILKSNSTQTLVLAVGLEFYKQVNNKMFKLFISSFNPISIVAVSKAP